MAAKNRTEGVKGLPSVSRSGRTPTHVPAVEALLTGVAVKEAVVYTPAKAVKNPAQVGQTIRRQVPNADVSVIGGVIYVWNTKARNAS